MGDDDTRAPHVLQQLRVGEVVEPRRTLGPDGRRAALDDELLVHAPEAAQEPVEREGLRPERDEDHARSKTVPR
jgi:hypothetical protein